MAAYLLNYTYMYLSENSRLSLGTRIENNFSTWSPFNETDWTEKFSGNFYIYILPACRATSAISFH
jgi:hypothetical protein